MTNKILTVTFVASFSLSIFTAVAAETVDISKLPPASDKKDVTYEKDIKPIFENTCFKCHGEEKQKGKLRVDSAAAILKGSADSDIGQIVKKGDSAHSTLVHAVARITPDEDDAMPPKKKDGTVNALTKEQVGLVRAWIDQGAK
jgi:mono/diheme cytochrome c family protein